MSFFFGDGFDLYASISDAFPSYWTTGSTTTALVAGRFSGSRALSGAVSVYLQKTSGQNDSVHHFNLAHQQTSALSGTGLGIKIQLMDDATNQCAVVFRQDGAILLYSGAAGIGAVLATYTGAVSGPNIWDGFEIEVVVHNTTGSIAVRKNGNTSNDFTATGLNTRGGTANNYANQVAIGFVGSAFTTYLDDFLWRSDAASVPWVGDVRCYTRMPVSDASVQWTPSGSVVPQPTFVSTTSPGAFGANTARYHPFVAVCNGTLGSVTLPITTASTANFKCAIFSSSAGVPGNVLGTATPISAPGVGTATWIFGTPVTVTQGTTYFVCVIPDASSGQYTQNSASNAGFQSTATAYAAWPVNNPTGLVAIPTPAYTVVITPSAGLTNAPFVADIQQDAAVTYVSSSTVGQTDLYNIAPISGTPTGIIGVTTRVLCQKSDAGTRNVELRLR
jgi:hypothetical protein